MHNLSALLAIFLLVLPSGGTSYYVDATGGNDFNNGSSPATAWKTIARVNIAILNPGDFVLLKRGEIWREQLTNNSQGIPGRVITYADYGTGNKPSIRGSNAYNGVADWTKESGTLWYTSFIAADPGVFIHDGSLGMRRTSKASLAAQWDYWFDSGHKRLYVYSTANPIGLASNLEIAVRAHFWNQFGIGYVDFTNIDLRHYSDIVWLSFAAVTVNFSNVDISQTAKYGIQYNNGGQGTVANCTFTDWGVVDGQQYAVHSIGYNGTGSGPVDVTGSTFTINHSMNTTELGAIVSDDNGWIRTVTNNTATNNGNWPGSAFWAWRPQAGATSMVYEGNSVYSVGSFAIGVQELNFYGAKPTVNISHNFIQDSDQLDILDTEALRIRDFSAATPVAVSYNVVNRTKAGRYEHAGIYLYGATGAKIYGNTIVGTDEGLLVKTGSAGSDIRNNISSFNRIYGVDVEDTSTVTTFTNNLFSTNGRSNYHGIGAGAADVTADPAFTNRSANLLTLQSTSPAISSGANVGEAYQGALLPASAWPKAVAIANQNAHGTGWGMGAFTRGDAVIKSPTPPTALTITGIN